VRVPEGWQEGKWNWVQLITVGRSRTYSDGKVSTHNQNGNKILDSNYPYDPTPYGAHPGNAGAHSTGETLGIHQDNPRVPLGSATSAVVAEAFEAYVMFLPDGQESRYVPLRILNWQWAGVGTSSGTSSGLFPTTGATPTPPSDTSTHPVWTNYFRIDDYN
jgi:hypothetical protein